jgi:MtfA peptidase
MLSTLFNTRRSLNDVTEVLAPKSQNYLNQQVSFYRRLNALDKLLFEKRILLFLETTAVVGEGVEVSDEDKLLVAASAIIPVWSFLDWHYFNLHTVILVPTAFNHQHQHGQADSSILGMVGTGPLSGKMVLSRQALHHGFSNDKDKRNTAIHEFVHLIDMADGDCDGFPERLKEFAFSVPWLELMHEKIGEIEKKKSNINAYGATNKQEFFAVASEYFFEQGEMLKKKHPRVYQGLSDFYQQDVASIKQSIQPKKKDPCPCGSGMRFKRCCLPNG